MTRHYRLADLWAAEVYDNRGDLVDVSAYYVTSTQALDAGVSIANQLERNQWQQQKQRQQQIARNPRPIGDAKQNINRWWHSVRQWFSGLFGN